MGDTSPQGLHAHFLSLPPILQYGFESRLKLQILFIYLFFLEIIVEEEGVGGGVGGGYVCGYCGVFLLFTGWWFQLISELKVTGVLVVQNER